MHRTITFFLLVITLVSCAPRTTGKLELISINLVDRNGMSQTISTKERLKQFENVDYLKPSSYQKVMRVYERNRNGDTEACITSYHPNGQIKQYLDVVNSRANGTYREWHANGKLQLDSRVIGGNADLDNVAQNSWLFDGLCKAWDEEGNLTACIPYNKGALEGVSLYYHPNGTPSKKIPYNKNIVNGTEEVFSASGALMEKNQYLQGLKHNLCESYWDNGSKRSEEFYDNGYLISGIYTSPEGENIGGVQESQGFRVIFNNDLSYELQEYRDGILAGKILQYSHKGILTKSYSVKNGFKNGEEVFYYPNRTQAKLSICWYEGRIQGICRTWYDNGRLESQREFSDNHRHGLSTAWYRNGDLMLIEEYEHDKIIKGEYHPRGESTLASRINNGKGICTLFDGEGNLIKKIPYADGKPNG